MRRRKFIVLAGAVACWPIAGWPQQGRRVRIGLLIPANPGPFFSEIREAMRSLGYSEGGNLEMVLRSADGNPSLVAAHAAELVDMKVDIIVAAQTPAIAALKSLTTEIPIVMASSGDPLGTGLVQSLARPGGNITGMSGTTSELGEKLLELLREIMPASDRVLVLTNPADPFTKTFLDQIAAGGRTSRIEVHAVDIHGIQDFEATFVKAATMQANAIIVQPSLPRKEPIDLALKHRIPTISSSSLFGREGGLLSYSADIAALYRRSAVFVDRILKGAKPSDLPVEQPTKFELIVNLKTAKKLGLTMPPTLLARADEVIE
jgi:putative ABC transport system substrate-binding protein